MENKAAKEFLETQQIEDCELQVGNVVLLSYPPQVPVKKLSQLLTDFASQQKPEIAWLSEIDEIRDAIDDELVRYSTDEAELHKHWSIGISDTCKYIQSELKNRVHPSDLQKEVETIKSDNSKINIALLEEVERLRKIETSCIKLLAYGQKQIELNREAVDLIKSEELKPEQTKVFQFRLAQGKFYGWRDSMKFLNEALNK